jgi:hypothetical protein
MPELSRFLGIVIAMYYRDHAPAHVQEWRLLHQNELLEAWALAQAQQSLPKIDPLE